MKPCQKDRGWWACLALILCGGFLQLGGAFAVEVTKPRAAVTGDIRNEKAFYSVVFYYSGKAPASAQDLVKGLAKKSLPGVPVLLNPGKEAKPPFIAIFEEDAPLKNYPVPEASYFTYAGRGMSEADVASAQKTTRATEVILLVPTQDIWKFARAFTNLSLTYAEETKAYLWDSATRECFTVAEWKKSRLDSWPATMEIPAINRHITIHLYRPDDSSLYLRAITLGMEKFGLPDLVIEKVIASDNRPAGNLINLASQSLAENPLITNGRATELDVSRIKNEEIRKKFQESYLSKATGKATLSLLDGVAQEGDANNALIELGFENYVGKSVDEKREMALSGLWGAEDSIKGVDHDEEILNASKRAREHLPELRKLVLTGLEPGERILLKAPFKRDDQGNEWMWVEVMDWKEEAQIKGVLQNDPFYIKNLKAGAAVTIQSGDVFDYIRVRGNGSQEGNETGEIIQKREGEVKSK